MTDTRKPLDVWLKFDSSEPERHDEEPSHEANVYHVEDTGSGAYCVEWYHTAVGQVTREWYPTYGAACASLEASGYQDFSS